ncbi:MAG TPA: tRNA uracil 4-sulfurtransferase ThiI [Spirochaetia bacterium]|nr:tRNA uracil 4-sulfurtransferase ThiI [Spirochaetia bacterium]
MDRLFLVKYGEIALKKRNRGAFVRSLKDSVRAKLPGVPVHVWETFHRVFVRYDPESRERIIQSLGRTFGVVSFSDALRVDNEMPQIEDAARELARGFAAAGLGGRFKAEVRRAEKSFPLTSYQIACRIGDILLTEIPGLTVDVHHPDWVLNVEIRERAYLYGREYPGPAGLPTGSSGRGLLLLSGGIDSPVAGYMMAKRGLAIEAVYFHSPPFTSEMARRKVESLVRVLAGYVPGIVLHVVNFTPVLGRIRERARLEETTLLLRACMMEFSCLLAARRAAACLVTGESLGQVASQTVESMHFTGSLATLPVLRPLVGMNKEEIIALARSLETFEISNLPYPDCCVLFSPDHPLIHPDVARMTRAYQKLDVGELLTEALGQIDTVSPVTAGADAT